MRVRLGVALGADAATAVVRGVAGLAPVTVELAWPGDGEDATATVASALRALERVIVDRLGRPVRSVSARIALLPPLADARLVPLPPLRRAEAEAVLRRDAARHFVGGNVARIVAVRTSPHGRPALAAAAPSAVVEAVRTAAGALGWNLEAIVPAHVAWRAAASRAPLSAVVAVHGDTAHVLRIERDVLSVLRKVPALPADIVEALGPGPGRLAVFADAMERDRIARTAAPAGWEPAQDAAASAAEAAAGHSSHAGLELVPATLAAERRRRDRALAARLAVAAVALLVAAAFVELWGARRELDAVRSRRAEIRDSVAPLVATRDSINRLHERAGAITSLTARAPRYTTALFDLALLLPADAHLTSLDASGDTITIEAAGARAGAAMQALRDAGSLQDVRLLGIVERELEDGSTVVERFRLTGRLAPAKHEVAHDSGPRATGSDLARREP